MNESQDQAVPAKCRQCSRPMTTPVVCDYCHALSPGAAMTDYFTLLGLPRRFELDEDDLQAKYLALSRHAHPDYHTGDSPEVQQLHLQVSSAVNDAYRTLKDPAARGAYLLELLGGASSAEDKSVPDGFLGTMMMLQEEIADAKTGEETGDLDRIGRVLQTQHDGLMRRITGLFEQYQEGMACEAVRKGLLGEIRSQLNAVSYVKKLLSQLP